MSDDPYQNVSKSKLKLKGDSGVKKKKSKKKEKRKVEEILQQIQEEQTYDDRYKNQEVNKKTKAELAFQKMKEKNQTKRILDKANMTHKERVEKFNQHLDGLTEHFDIPKVSWTK